MNRERKKKIRGVIFDVDGTLLDSMEIWGHAGERYLETLGIHADSNLSETLFAMTLEEAAVYLKDLYDLPVSVAELIRGVEEQIRDFYDFEAPLKTGMKELIEEFRKRNIPMSIATSGKRSLVEGAFRRLGILGYFQKIYTCTEIGESKRNPQIYQKACKEMGLQPEECAVFEDALYALKTAKLAGFYTIAVEDESNHSSWKELCELADAILCGKEDLEKISLLF